jgi:long-subunit acyl-CoA synthetase (AMP-forming)
MEAAMGTSHAATATRDGDAIRSTRASIGERETITSMLVRNAGHLGQHPVYSERREGGFRDVGWDAFLDEVVAFGRFLSASGVRPGDRVLVFSPNRGEMLVTEMAVMSLGAVYVPIFAAYPADQAQTLITHSRPVAMVLPGADHLQRACFPPTVRTLVTFDPVPPETINRALEGTAVRHVPYPEAVRDYRVAGESDPHRAEFLEAAMRRDPDQPFLMMYTSGTSGRSKGVLLTQDNILSQQRALAAVWDISGADRFLSYLPWHHSFGGLFEKYSALYNGATIWLDDSHGKDFERLLDNWMKVRPTVYFSVPKVFQQLVVHAQTHPAELPEIFHPELRFVFTAAAPLPANISRFFASRGVAVLEGWGLTETAPCCTVTDMAEPRTTPGMVGYPIPDVRVRIAADGEILVQGPNVMKGYFDNPEDTARALPGDGWFHTGDLGEFAGAGLKLVARKDRVFKMLNAEKIVPTEIENRLAGMNPYIRHVVVTGSGRSFLAALIFPDFFRIAQEFGDDRATADRVVKASLRDTIIAFNHDHPVKYERIEAFAVVSKELTIEEHELTPSLKVRVQNVLESSAGYLDAVYEPSADCDCRFLRKVLRLAPDERVCFTGRDRTLDRCHECGSLVFGEMTLGETTT